MIREETDLIRRCVFCQAIATHVEASQPYKTMSKRLRTLCALGRALSREASALMRMMDASTFWCATHGTSA